MFGSSAAKNFGRELSIEPPAPDRDRKGVAIMACVKDEAAYIEEWAQFHRAIGVCHFYIYDDGSTDGTMQRLARLLGPALTIVPWRLRASDTKSGEFLNGQTIAFAHALLNFGAAHERMAFIDADEFLLPKRGSSIQEALEGAGGFPCISLPWHMFGFSGHKTKPPTPVTLSYTMRVDDPLRQHLDVSNFKCIVDPAEVVGVGVHRFRTRQFGDTTSNDAGFKASGSGRKKASFYSNAFLQLNHYYSKSEEEAAAKLSRGWSFDKAAEKYRNKVLSTTDYIERHVVEDRAMVDFIRNNNIDLAAPQ